VAAAYLSEECIMKSNALVFGSLILSGAAFPKLHAQNYVISTFAGGGAPLEAPAPALTVPLGYGLYGITTDAAGNVYLASQALQSAFKLDANGVLTRIAGNGRGGYSGDGGPATEAQLNFPGSVAVDGAGNLYIGEVDRVRRVSPGGIITTIAGNGSPGHSPDGGAATDAQISPRALAVDRAGNLFVADPYSFLIRKITADGLIRTIAGNGSFGASGDNGPAIAAQLSGPNGVAVDSTGNVFIADGPRVRKVSPTGIITTVAGGGTAPCCTIPSGDGGPATSAVLFPQGVTTDDAGNLYITDMNRLRKVTPDGIITTVAGTGSWGYSGDGGPATSAQLENLAAVALDGKQALLITDGPRVRKISKDGTIATVAGNDGNCCFSGDGGPATSAQLNYPSDVAVDAAGNVFIADTGNHRIRKVSPDGVITTLTASAQNDYGLIGLAVEQRGTLLIADVPHHVVRRVSLDGSSTVVAGNGAQGPSGDGGPATSAQLAWPTRVTTDRAGNIFIMDNSGSRIRKVAPDGIITTLAGSGNYYGGFSGDGGPAVDAQLETDGGCDGPGGGMAVDVVGDLYFADTYNNRIRQIAPNGTINTVGGSNQYAFSGDGGPLNNATFAEPFSVAFDPAGNLFIAARKQPHTKGHA
jgi:sugar lactone lactonase YvrE